MADKLSVAARSENMRKIRSKGMKPEITIRKLVHSLGYRYRLHKSDLPGKPDLVFSRLKKIIFVNGCFWHQHQDSKCHIVRKPKSNLDFWLPKLERTRKRDEENLLKLSQLGWQSMVIWECEISRNYELLIKRIKKFLSN